MDQSYLFFGVLLASYLLGSIPFGVLAGKLGGVDVRTVGSGNVGTTNVWRALGPAAGISVFSLDVIKGVAGPLMGLWILGKAHPWGIALCALAAVLGHIFSLFLRLKGGKGIATGLGAMLGLWAPGALAAFGVWLLFFLIFRMVSLASLAACLFLPILAWVFHVPMAYLLVISTFCLVAFLKHLPNLKRILNGTESKVSLKRRKSHKSTFEVQKPEGKS